MMRLWLTLLLAVLLPASSWAAAFTSKATGNWSASGQTTWNETGVPGAGDTASIGTGHAVTVDANTTIGTSGVAGTAAILVTGTGSLTVATGVTLTARGDVNLANAVMTMAAGSALTFDDNSSAAVYILHIGTASSQSSKLLCNGTAGSRVTISSKSGGTNGRISDGGFTNGGYVDCAYTNFTRIGDATHNAFDTWAGNGKVFRLTNSICDACGKLKTTVAPGVTAIFKVDSVTFKNSVGTLTLDVNFSGTPSGSGAWDITNNVFDKGLNIQPPINVTISGNVFMDRPIFTNAAALALSGNLFYKTVSTDTNIYSDLTNNYILINVASNPHGMNIAGTRDIAVTGNVVEYLGTTGDGDMFLMGSPATAQTYTLRHNLILPAAGAASTVSSGDMVSAIFGANVTIVAEHNTFNVGAQGEDGIHIGETYSGRAGFIPSIQNNLAWSNSGSGYIVTTQNPGAFVNNSITTLDYNGRTAMTASYSIPAGTVLNSPEGTHDVVGDPGFVDKTRNIATWDLSLGGPGTAANALTELGKRNDASGYNPAYTIAALIAYVKAGFVPTNAAFHTANDSIVPSNGWMGAMQGVASTVAIPQLALWQSHMTSAGAARCATLIADTALGTTEPAFTDTYYDSLAVYTQIQTYTGDLTTWLPCIQASRTVFRDRYVIGNGGATGGIYNFSRGLKLDFLTNADATSKSAQILQSHNSVYSVDTQNQSFIASPARSREVAYAIRGYVNSELLGDGRRAHLLDYVNIALSHIDQWFISKSYRCEVTTCTEALLGPAYADAVGKYIVHPFMVGLTMEALISYYGVETDPVKKANIVTNVKIAADWIWNNAWVVADQAFWYNNWAATADTLPTPTVSASGSAPDLNLLIVPAYGWLYYVTGDTTYRDRGDQIFAKGVTDGFIAQPKQFNQQYQTSFDYVSWRQATPLVTALNAPTGLRAVGAASATGTTLNWTPSTDPTILGYIIYRGTASGQTTRLLSISNATAAASFSPLGRFIDTSLRTAGTYYYTVTAYSATDESVKSSEVSATVTGLPARTATTTRRAR